MIKIALLHVYVHNYLNLSIITSWSVITTYCLLWGIYQVDVSQLQMVIAGYIYNYEHVITLRLISAMEHLIQA